jgi:hypothetical protein
MKKSLFIIVFLVSALFINAQELTNKYIISLDGNEGTEISISAAKMIEAGEFRIAPTKSQMIAFNLEYEENGIKKVLSARSRTITKEMKEAISKLKEGDVIKITGIVLAELKEVYSVPDITITITDSEQ